MRCDDAASVLSLSHSLSTSLLVAPGVLVDEIEFSLTYSSRTVALDRLATEQVDRHRRVGAARLREVHVLAHLDGYRGRSQVSV